MVNPNANEKFLYEGLTFDDVLLIPAKSDVLPKDCCTKWEFAECRFQKSECRIVSLCAAVAAPVNKIT